MKKILAMLVTSALCFGAVLTFGATEAKAAAPCSIDTINVANAQIANAQNAYLAAVAAENAALANLNAVKAAGGSQLDITVAANAYTTAQNATRWYLDQVNNAKAFLANISARADFETDLMNSIEAGKVLTNLQAVKAEADGAANIAAAAGDQIKATQNAILGYQQMLATCPSVQAQIDALTTQLAAQQADYAAKKATADQKMAVYQAAVAAGGYQAYDQAVIDRWYHRDNVRDQHLTNCPCDLCEANREAAKASSGCCGN